MQRALVILAVVLLVTVSLAAGALAAHWPFWMRAWQWHSAAGDWPASLPGPTLVLKGGKTALPLDLAAGPALAESDGGTQILLLADTEGHGAAFFAPGYHAASQVDGRGLSAGLLAPLFGLLGASHPGLLDTALRTDAVTPRHLLWQLSGFTGSDFQPLNPLSARAQLASGPDFERASLHWKQAWPAGSHFEESPVNQQLLAITAAQVAGKPYAELLEEQLWSRLAADEAVAMLDHLRGSIAAHCCMRASAADWLRVGLLLADDGRIAGQRVLPAGFVDSMTVASPVHPGYGLGYRVANFPAAGRVLALETTGRTLLIAPELRKALLWIGTGTAPAGLHRLLGAEAAGGDRTNDE